MGTDAPRPVACVAGDMDLVRALAIAGIPCVVAAPANSPQRYTRFKRGTLDWSDSWQDPERQVETLLRFGAAQPAPPVLFYEDDGDLLLVSRHRDILRQAFRFVVAEQTLVEDLVDKARFQALAASLGLQVPHAVCVRPWEQTLDAVECDYPAIVKPLTRRPAAWALICEAGKALQIDSRAELTAPWERAARLQMPLMIQTLVPGAETAIESYHVYVGEDHRIVADFTGRKLRTFPARFGDSTALAITQAEDVAVLGRQIVSRLKLTGVAKFDFKRDPDGRLYLLEINPRFTLWHHLGAAAAVNIPALVYADLCGFPRPAIHPARAGASWCRAWQDVHAARELGVPLAHWARFVVACDAKSVIAWDDPLPFLAGLVWRGLAKVPFAGRAHA